MRECSDFIDPHAVVKLSQHCLLKRLSFLHCIFCLFCCRLIKDAWVFILGLCNVFVIVPVPWCLDYCSFVLMTGLSQWLSGKEFVCNAEDAGDSGLIPGLERSPEEGNGNPFHYSCLGTPMGREDWQAIVHGLPRWLSCKESACNAGDPGLIPEWESFPGEGIDYPL